MGLIDQLKEAKLRNKNLKLGDPESLWKNFEESQKNYIEAIKFLDESIPYINAKLKEIFIIDGGIWAICLNCGSQFQIKGKFECTRCKKVSIK